MGPDCQRLVARAVLEDFVENRRNLLGPFTWSYNRPYWVREWCVHSVRDQFRMPDSFTTSSRNSSN